MLAASQAQRSIMTRKIWKVVKQKIKRHAKKKTRFTARKSTNDIETFNQ
jgi:hypothetical protein